MNNQKEVFISINNSKGFTLLEVLIAVLILSIGLLGIAGLQAKGLQFNHSAYLRTQATFLAYDISDRMRANIVGVDAGNYNNGTASQHTNCITASTSSCTPAIMAGHDLYEWNTTLASALPSGQGIVCVDSDANTDAGTFASPNCGTGTGTLSAIKIWWTDDRTGTAKRFVMTFEP